MGLTRRNRSSRGTGARRAYIGLACSFHDSALAIVGDDGEVRFCESTERHLQDKRAMNVVPDRLLQIPDLLAEHCPPGAELVLAKTWTQRSHLSDVQLLVRRYSNHSGAARFASLAQLASTALAGNNIRLYAGNRGLYGVDVEAVEVRAYDHHRTHAANACYTSDGSDAAVAILDGLGQGTSTSYFRFVDGRLERLPGSVSVNSLGLFYAYVTDWCGFSPFKGEEWKVMGLAGYGTVDPDIERTMRSIVDTDGLRLVYPTDRAGYRAALARMAHLGREAAGDQDARAAIAATGQAVFADRAAAVLTALHERTGIDHLVVGGGCFLNSAFNGQIVERTPFTSVHVPFAPADDGNALGAALLAYLDDHPERARSLSVGSPFLGSRASKLTIEHVVRFSGVPDVRQRPDWGPRQVAEVLAAGGIVGVMRGRAEMGPRALGNRSILADPRDPGIKDAINERVKFREQFRPLAPCVLPDHVDDLFVNCQRSPYMDRALVTTTKMQELAPGAVHVDGTARLQSVDRDRSPFLAEVLEAFFDLTGVPVLINTSLNVMGKPIVHSVEDALATYLTTGLDALVVEDLLLQKGTP